MFARFMNRLAGRPSPRRPRFCRPLPLRLEYLEDRTLLTGHVLSNATLLPPFSAGRTTTASVFPRQAGPD